MIALESSGELSPHSRELMPTSSGMFMPIGKKDMWARGVEGRLAFSRPRRVWRDSCFRRRWNVGFGEAVTEDDIQELYCCPNGRSSASKPFVDPGWAEWSTVDRASASEGSEKNQEENFKIRKMKTKAKVSVNYIYTSTFNIKTQV